MATRKRPFSGKPIQPPPLPAPAPASVPINALPAGVTTYINVAKVFSQANGNPITVADTDSPILTVVLLTAQGTIEIVPNANVVITDNKTNRVTISGSPARINAALNGMKFTPSASFSGVATIQVRTSDGLNVDIDTLNVTVSGVAPPPPAPGPAPQNSIPGPQQATSGANLAFTGANIFSIADSDSTALTTTLTTTNGKVTVSTGGGATITGNGTALVTIAGTVGQINAALATAVFQSTPGYVGAAQITVSTTDGVSTDTDMVQITVSTSGGTAPAPSGPTTPPFYPFGSRLDLIGGKYPYGTVVSNRTASAMDTDLRNKYNEWKSARVYNVPAISGAKAVKFTDAPYPNTTNALTVSEGMGYGMLLAALFHDQATFDGLLRLVRARPAYSTPAGAAQANLYLMDWKLGPNGESSDNYGGGWGATDGDLDIAQALCMAWRQWGTTGTTYNYKTEAQKTIAAIKQWYFNATDTTFGSNGSDVHRLSDDMPGHFRSFASITGDAWWTTNVIPRAIAIIDKCQTVFSAANGGPGCFIPDAVVNTNGILAGQAINQSNITNFAQAFGLGSSVYGSGSMNFVPSPGGRLDFTPTEMHHYANSQRCGFRLAADAIFSGNASFKEQCNRINRFVPGFLQNNPANCPVGFRLNGGEQGPQGGGISMGNAWPARGTIQGFMNGAQVDPAYQAWLNSCYDYMMANWVTFYYDCELMLLGMVMASGNWFTYPGVVTGGGGGVTTNPNAPVNSVPGAQNVATGGTKTFNAANSNQISVTDPNSDQLTVNVTCAHGTIKATQSAGQTTLADGFPSKIIYGYWPGWGQQRLTSVSQNYNVISLFSARNAGNNVGDGSVVWEWPGFPTSAEVQEVRARGQKVILAVGGAGRGYLYNTRAKSTALVNSLISIINAFGGVDGVDYNFYEGGITDAGNQATMATEMVWIAGQLKAQYGANFAIVSPPQPNSPVDQYLMLQLANANCLTWCNPQYYDWSGFKEVGFISGLSGGINRNKTWVDLLGQTRVAVGMSANYDYASSLTLAEANREWDAVASPYPNERGVSAWNTELDATGGNAFANNFKAKFGSASSGGVAGATVNNNNSNNVQIVGTIANVNAALNGLIYTPTAAYAGTDSITITTTDGVYSDTDSIAVTVGSGAPPPPPPPAPAPPAGSTGLDVLEAKFGAGDNGAWLDPVPVSRFQTFYTGGADLTAYGDGTGGTGLFGRWKDRSGRGHDFIETDQFSRPSAHSVGGIARAAIYDRGPIQNAGGINGPFYMCAVVETDTYYGNWLSDRTANFNGVQLGHDADNSGPGGGTGDIYVSAGTGAARVVARCFSNVAAQYTILSGKHLVECWYDGTNLTVRFDKGTGNKTASTALSGISAGGPDMLIGADMPNGNDWIIGNYFQVVVLRNGCPTQTERDLIATFAASRAGLTL